ncbi:hypothetical protein E2562_001933 [Oryza meyeriana var. granulata]|uniref:Uncharacterized protein n=1 Tax=Oryza meyeriana var. granulata TaxID=110450 RepID=A0A6G1C2F8_9ORYZ|nr:hypothetical protein E2562_001933 [Oryza meyeriana var. granulata]
MEEFTFFSGVAGGQCKIPAATTLSSSSPRRDHQLGLGCPPPWLLAAVAEDDDGDDGGEEEKMDLLWEDFNEELARTPPVCPLSPLNIKGGGLTAMAKDAWLDAGGGERARRMYSGSVVRRRRRWSLLLMLRLLKNLFLAKNTRNARTAPI